MNVLAWILTALLALAMLGAGGNKLAVSRDTLLKDPKMSWAEDFSGAQIKAIAAAEVIGALGLVLPWLLTIAPVLTPLAAVGLALVMVGALIVHGRRGELRQALPVNTAFLLLAVVVAVIRFSQL